MNSDPDERSLRKTIVYNGKSQWAEKGFPYSLMLESLLAVL